MPSDPDEQPVRRATARVAAVVQVAIGSVRIPPIYATLADVLELTGTQECCRA